MCKDPSLIRKITHRQKNISGIFRSDYQDFAMNFKSDLDNLGMIYSNLSGLYKNRTGFKMEILNRITRIRT